MKQINSKVIVSLILLVAALILNIRVSSAACVTNAQGVTPQIVSAAQPAVIVQRDVPVGTVLGSFTFPGTGYYVVCSGGGNVYYHLPLFPTPTSINGVYATNVPGVGFDMTPYSNTFVFVSPLPPPGTTNVFQSSAEKTINIVKTGPITSGVVSSGVLYTKSGDDNITSFTGDLIGNTITQLACSISTPNIQVPLDDLSSSSLTAIGTTAKPKDFNVGLNCDAGARINATLTATQNSDTSADGVLQLSGAGNSNVASGVGIQILYNGTPMALNTNMVLKTSAGGLESFPFTAQYYQTKATVTAGSANTTATLELTYQ